MTPIDDSPCLGYAAHDYASHFVLAGKDDRPESWGDEINRVLPASLHESFRSMC
jgi:hypothetical protein